MKATVVLFLVAVLVLMFKQGGALPRRHSAKSSDSDLETNLVGDWPNPGSLGSFSIPEGFLQSSGPGDNGETDSVANEPKDVYGWSKMYVYATCATLGRAGLSVLSAASHMAEIIVEDLEKTAGLNIQCCNMNSNLK